MFALLGNESSVIFDSANGGCACFFGIESQLALSLEKTDGPEISEPFGRPLLLELLALKRMRPPPGATISKGRACRIASADQTNRMGPELSMGWADSR